MTDKGFKEAMRKLREEDRLIRINEARLEGRRYSESATDEEQAAFDAQQHQYFSDWSLEDQERFKNEQSAMWALIPEKHKAKAEQFARGH